MFVGVLHWVGHIGECKECNLREMLNSRLADEVNFHKETIRALRDDNSILMQRLGLIRQEIEGDLTDSIPGFETYPRKIMRLEKIARERMKSAK